MVFTPFPCTACGKCCRLVGNNEQTAFLDRGDGVCRHFDEATNLCGIYADRPLVCRVEDYYRTYFSEQTTWEDFVRINVEICRKLP
ncbi:YkgJ family cysteine cluster protein [Neisseria animalis]|uniref:YkgJ family cysteine cluster protein n=2 Tax=Neisseria animalis TaxID=492 RepID=A0A5P3MSM4_NEIAN|nr:YkgJ family cysteine cluster protein [Neisseria animalis]QEY24613.1 YkgJ family cysteine cluster protein [Neisseria animalis]ROW32975.1 YkgJ family cysteine cluster protein [Neisseria animalis]